MRIAFVSPYDFSYPGGVTKHISNLSGTLRRLGHQTCIIAPASRKDRETAPPELVSVSHFVVPVRCNGSLARLCLSPLLYFQVRRRLRHIHCEVLHLHEPTNPTLPQAVLHQASRWLPNAAIVATFHSYGGDDSQQRLRRLTGRAYRSMCHHTAARLDGRIAVSPLARDYAIRSVPGPYRVIPNGVDTALFGGPSVEPTDRSQDGARILFVGRLEPRKGFDYLLDAYTRVLAELPEARLLVVGPYSSGDVQPFRRRLRKISVSGVHFLGCVAEKDLAGYYRNSHVFCAPSTGLESFGMVLLEAMAAGVPIVASDIEGYRAVLKHGAEGLLVPPRDPGALADALLHLLRHPEIRQAMGRRGQSTAARYTWQRVAAEVLEFYGDVLERKMAGARAWSGLVHSSALPVAE